MRLLAASRRLADFIVERVSDDTRQLLSGPLKELAPTGTVSSDRAAYVTKLDGLCAAVAGHLARHFDLERRST